ncbi:hypothetical protein SAMN05216466_11610 [Paraburkholderia phenazinium]|uniref:Glycine zipper n=1 Tax=Paraburkholderia phenazinium TaxID=60549 RepID=A0A1G8H520_9BURK|nr:hypothetical protein [Paraburkholderia phenazinium]SDI01754.1 hypothetical protein SAMN05216466_11610 [Paraburkholderia phenazinium]
MVTCGGRGWAVATGDGNRAEKARGFAGIAGSLAGGVLGAKAGALVGAVGGPIGVAIGGLIGGAIGTYAGEKALGAAAKWAFSRGDAQPAADALVKAKALDKPGAVDKPVVKVDQKNTFAPVFHVVLQGDQGGNGSDAADRFLAKVSPQLQRMMKDQLAKSNRSAMFDSPHL